MAPSSPSTSPHSTACQKTKTPRNQVNCSPPEFIFPDSRASNAGVRRKEKKTTRGRVWPAIGQRQDCRACCSLGGGEELGAGLRWARWARVGQERRRKGEGLEGCKAGVAEGRRSFWKSSWLPPSGIGRSPGPAVRGCCARMGTPGGETHLLSLHPTSATYVPVRDR